MPLFDRSFQRDIERLRPLWRRRMAQAAFFRRQIRIGDGPEFCDLHPYSPGDDFRRIDWPGFLRHDVLRVRRFQEQEEPRFVLLLDCNASMSGYWDCARRLVGCLAFLALESGASVSLFAGATKLEYSLPALRGFGAAKRALALLEEADPQASPTRLDRWLGESLDLAAGTGRRSVVILVSDLYAPLAPALDRPRAGGHDLAVFHVFSAADGWLTGQGRLQWTCPETGRSLTVDWDGAKRDAYRDRWLAFRDACRREVERRGGRYQPCPVSTSPGELLLEFLGRNTQAAQPLDEPPI